MVVLVGLADIVLRPGPGLLECIFRSSRLRHATLLKKDSDTSCPTQVFPCKFYEIFKNTFLIELLQWLLLDFDGDGFLSEKYLNLEKQTIYWRSYLFPKEYLYPSRIRTMCASQKYLKNFERAWKKIVCIVVDW